MARPIGKEGETQAMVALLLARFPTMRRKEIAKKLGISSATVNHHINNIEDTPEHAVAMRLLANTIPDGSLIIALEHKRILDKVLAGEALSTDEIRTVQGALKGGRVYQERSQVDESKDVNALLETLLATIQQLPHDQQVQLIERYSVMVTQGKQVAGGTAPVPAPLCDQRLDGGTDDSNNPFRPPLLPPTPKFSEEDD
jgi:hypothetical protein